MSPDEHGETGHFEVSDNWPVLPPAHPVSRWVRLKGLKWNLVDAWRCLRGTHYAEEYLD